MLFRSSIFIIFRTINPNLLKNEIDFEISFDGDSNASAEKEVTLDDLRKVGGSTSSTTVTNNGGVVTVGGVVDCPQGLEVVQKNILLCASVAKNMRELLAAAAKDGIILDINSGYRKTESCQLTGGTCAKGISNHQRAIAVDFNGGFKTNGGSNPKYIWLTKNAAKYGFYNILVTQFKKYDEYNHWSTTGR